MEGIAADVELFYLGIADFDAFLIDPCVEGALNFEAGLCRCRRDQIDDCGTICERMAARILSDVAEQAMFDLVPFRRAWRIVPNLDGETGLIGELLQPDFPEPHARTV